MNKAIPPKVQDLFQKLYDLISDQAEAEVMALMTNAFRRPSGAPSSRKPPKVFKVKGSKRSPEQIAQQTEQVLKFISSNPDKRAEEIASGTGISTGDLPIVIKRLVSEKKVKATGVARGTRYIAR